MRSGPVRLSANLLLIEITLDGHRKKHSGLYIFTFTCHILITMNISSALLDVDISQDLRADILQQAANARDQTMIIQTGVGTIAWCIY